MGGFYILNQVNHLRTNCFKIYNSTEKASATKCAIWLGHKVLTIISLPLNTLAAGVGIAGMVATASTLGTLKIAIFAATLGNIKPTFPTGFVWFAQSTGKASYQIFSNLTELVLDLFETIHKSYRAIRWVAQKLHIDQVVQAIFKQVEATFTFIATRVAAGFAKAAESDSSFKQATISLHPLDVLTSKYRINFSSHDRPLSAIAAHMTLSLANIPLNALIATVSLAASCVLATAFCIKAGLYATTSIDARINTHLADVVNVMANAALSAGIDTLNDLFDVPVTIYQISKMLGLNKVAATALRVLAYIPEAICQ